MSQIGWAARRRLSRIKAVSDARAEARRALPRPIFDYIDGAAGSETTAAANFESLVRVRLRPRVASGQGAGDPSTTLLGVAARLPLVIAPTGQTALAHPAGELALVRAAGTLGIPYCLSTNSSASIEAVAEAAAGATDLWYQLYPLKDRDRTHALMARAAAAGYRVLCVTLDTAAQGRRLRERRAGMSVPLKPSLYLRLATHPLWMIRRALDPPRFGNFAGEGSFTDTARRFAALMNTAISWDDVAEIRRAWSGPMAVKGVLHPDDARRAVEAGAEAVIVSTHGGRQLDGALGAADALPAVLDAVAGRAAVILDSGIRSGVDLLKARALGADAGMTGRPFLYGLAAGGEAGARHVGELFGEELKDALALCGIARFTDAGPDLLAPCLAGR